MKTPSSPTSTAAIVLAAVLAFIPHEAHSIVSGSSAEWNAIADTTIYDSRRISHNGTAPSNLFGQGGIFQDANQNGNYGSWQSDSFGEVTSSRDLRVYAKTFVSGIGGGSPSALPSRINAEALAFFGGAWLARSPDPLRTSFPAFGSVQWDGQLVMKVPTPLGSPALGTSPNFSEVGVSLEYRVFELDANFPSSEPTPVLQYVSNDHLVLRADGKNGNGDDFAAFLGDFDRAVEEFDPANPWTPTGTIYNLDISATPIAGLGAGEYGFDLEIGGNLIPFSATVGKRYLVEYGMSVYANVTGAEGSAEADFLNTGSVSFQAQTPGDGSFSPVAVPEPASGAVLMGLTALLRVFSGRRLR